MRNRPTPNQLFAQATQTHQAGDIRQAKLLYQRILAHTPNHADAHHLLGLLYGQEGDLNKALRHIHKAVQIAGDNPIYLNNLGEVYRRQGKLDLAMESYRRALALTPDFAEAHYNLANVLKAKDDLEQAIHHYQEAVRLKPNYANAHYNLGNTLLEQGRFRSAMSCYREVVRLNPTFAEAHNNLGITLQEWDRPDEALQSYAVALQIKPDYADAHRNTALVLEKQGKIDAARQSYRHVLAQEPDNDLLRLHAETLCPIIPMSNAEIDAWRGELAETLARYASRPPKVDLERLHLSGGEPPSTMVYQGRDDRPLKEQWAALFQNQFPAHEHKVSTDKPHVGFVVTHGHEGVFLKCMRGIIEHFPADRFRVTVVCSRQGGVQVLRQEIANTAVTYLPLSPRFDRALVQMREARFDLLHFWEVGTDVTNYFLPFCRLAPIQCATWGWPVTTGIPQMDYFISCELLETEGSDTSYTETLIRLPHLPTYYPRPPVPERLHSRNHFDLTDEQHVYLCAQNLRKVHPDFDILASKILRCDPLGVLLFVEDKQPSITDLLRRRFQTTMPDVITRVRFMDRMPAQEYLNLIALADVVLDTLHYGGGANTTYDAFATGTPMVTLPGRFHRGRYTAAAYRQIGVSGCIAASAEDYVEIALRLGEDAAYRAEVGANIARECLALFEDGRAVRELFGFFEQVLSAR